MESSVIVGPLLLGGLLGLIGQSLRVIVGLKKTYDVTSHQNTPFAESFDGKQLLVSLLIGFVAGTLGVLVQMDFKNSFNWTKDITIEVIAVGYAGADFIEGFIKKYLPSSTGDSYTPAATTTATPTEDIVG